MDNKANELYDTWNMSGVVNENVAKNKFSELKYDQEKIKEWFQFKIEENKNKKSEDLYKELLTKFNNLGEKIKKDEVIKIIKQENFDLDKISQWIESQIEQDPKPKVPIRGEDPKLDQMVDGYDEEYNILTLIDEIILRAKILELNYDDPTIREWISNKLSE